MFKIAGVLVLVIAGAAVFVATALASGATCARSLTTPVWARPLAGVKPYTVERNFGTSRGVTCDLAVYTTNRAALEGKARLRPGDVTATVCVVRKVAG